MYPLECWAHAAATRVVPDMRHAFLEIYELTPWL